MPPLPYTITGSAPGKRLLILAGVHGNEPCGVRAFERVIPGLEIVRGSVTFAIGNPRALGAGVRCIDANLNRQFFTKETEGQGYEYARAKELRPLLEEADALLDIHASLTPDSTPFVICEPHSFGIAEQMPVSIVSSGWDTHEAGSTDSFVNAHGGNGMCIECGYTASEESVERAVEGIHAFLVATGAIDGEPHASPKRHVEVYAIHRTKTDFTPARSFQDFERVLKDELIGTDGGEEVRADEDACVIFVRSREKAGEEAFLLGRESEKP